MTRPDLHSLLERVRSAEKGSRELDALIAVWAINHQPRSFAELQDGLPDGTYYYESGDEGEEPEQFGLAVAARYSASIDAVVSLIEKELPGWHLEMSMTDGIADDLYLIGPNYRDDKPEVNASPPFGGKPVALACLAALLAAKLSMENTDAEA